MAATDSLAQIDQYLEASADKCVEDLKAFLRIPSVSADSRHRGDMEAAAQFVYDQLTAAGLTAEIVPTNGHPIVYGEWISSESVPTVLVYGHYDVQPPDPLDLWTTPPFEPEIRDGRIYARGATDDKGQMLTHVKAVEAWKQTVGALPVNVKFVIEGEEEVGSDNLERFLSAHRERCRCDVAVISDTSQYGPGIPAITYGLRGILAVEFTVHGPNRDLHSGVFGGAVANPANALARLVTLLHDSNGRVTIPGFYNDVVDLTKEERRQFADLSFDPKKFCSDLGISESVGEDGYTILERRWARPTCDVNGIFGGYCGEGPKTIVPAKATAKVTCRLVPNQDPTKITASLKRYLEKNCPEGTRLQFIEYHGCLGVVMSLDSPYMQAARTAIEEAFGRQPVMIREGGSIPVVGTFKEVFGVDTLLLGWGQNADNLHSPNESFTVADYHRGIRASAHLWHHLAQK